MPKFKVETTSPLSDKDAFLKLKNFLSSGEELKKFDPHIQCHFNDAELKCLAKGKQFSANIHIESSQDGSMVIVEIEIPFILTPLKGKIQETLQRKLSKALS